MRGQIFNLYHMEDGEGLWKSGFNSRTIKNTIKPLDCIQCSKIRVL